MKFYQKLIIVPFVLGALYGCNDDDVDQDELVTDTNQATETNQNDTNQTEAIATSYNFTHFDLDVDYANDVSYDVEYAKTLNGVTAEIDDEVNKVQLKGDAANNELVKRFESLTIDANSQDDEVLSEVINAFELDENFKTLELEVKFNDGEVKRYNSKK